MRTRFCTFVMAVCLVIGLYSAASAVSLTSITIDPENDTGATTNAPGAWSTGTGDPLSQVAVISSDGLFLNQGSDSGVLGEIDIPLEPGINRFTLIGNMTFPGNLFYGSILFFDGQVIHPQVAVFNENGTLGNFQVQDAGTKIMGGANGGWFFDEAPGTHVYIAPDGTEVEVLSFVINSMSSNTDEISFGEIGPDGKYDTTAELILLVTAPKSIKGSISLMGTPLVGSKVVLRQNREPKQTGYTDNNGCYSFNSIASGKSFRVTVHGPTVPID